MNMNKTILYVDDEPWFADALYDALQSEGYSLLKAKSGTEAIRLLTESVASDTTPDLIILDVIMPMGENENSILRGGDGGRRTGIKVYEVIRKQLNLSVPIIFATVVDDPMMERIVEQSEKSLGIGTFSILVKPILPTELIGVVNRILKSPITRK
jgi:CheY-like chemotaxis protein